MIKIQTVKTQGERPKGICWVLKSINKKNGMFTWQRKCMSIPKPTFYGEQY